ncbi:MAG: hypothetical protein VX724_02595 [Chloroflexota bacterium]|nr:hypothetical protein [Chloroflexota bacterium]
MAEWIAVIGWSSGSVAGGIVLYRKVRFFSTLWGAITMGLTGVLSGAVHSLLNAMFSINEPFLFFIGIFGMGITPILFAQWTFTGLSRLYTQWHQP